MLNEVKIKYSVDSSELQKATEAFDKLTAEEKAANAALDKFQANLRETGGDSTAGLGPATAGAIKFGAAIGKSQSQVRQFTTSLREAGAAAVTAGNKAAAGFSGVEAQLRKNQAAVAAFQRQLAQTKMPTTATAGGGGKGDLLSQLTNMVKLGGKIYLAKELYDTAIAMAKMGGQVEALNAQFKFLTGSSSAAQAQIESLKSLSNNIGVSFETASGAYKDFATSAILAGQSLEATNDQFKAVVVASRAMGLSSEQMDGAFRAFEQSLSKGVLQAEELRGQLSERIPGAFAMTADAIGVSEQELGNMISSGNVMAKDVLPLLAIQMQQTFGPQMVEMTNSLGASMERFFNNLKGDAKSASSAAGPLLKYMFDSLSFWDKSIRGIWDKLTMNSDEYTAKQISNIKENIKYNAELEISQNQIKIAQERGVKASEVTRADAARRSLQQTTAQFDALKNAAENYGKTDPRIQTEYQYALIRRNVMMNEVKKEKEAVALRQKVIDDAAKGNADKEAKAAKAKAEKAERDRLKAIKDEFDAEQTKIEDSKKIAKIELESSTKSAQQKAVELLLIEEKYLQDLIALRERYAKKEPKLAKDFTKGKKVEQAELGAVQQALPTAGVEEMVANLQKVEDERQSTLKKGYENEKNASAARMNIREAEIDAMDVTEQKKRKLKIESEIKANDELIAINNKYDDQALKDAMDASDTENAELIAKNKALQAELTKIDKEGNQERADIVSAYGQHIQSVFNGAMQLYQQNLAADLDASQARYAEEERLAGDNKQKLTELREKQRAEEREIKRKQFEAQKVAAIADVVFNTAPIIAKYGSQVFTTPLALVALAAQAAQIAFILAQPVPEFAQGTRGRRHKGGPAMVGELGVEKVITESGKVYYTPPTATLVDLPKGSQVIPNHELRKELFYASNMSRASGASVDPVVTGISEIGGILKSLPIHQINMDERGFEKYIRTPKRATKILNSRFPGN